MEIEKPKGEFQCSACGRVWDGSALYLVENVTRIIWSCGNLQCGANVRPVFPEDRTKWDFYFNGDKVRYTGEWRVMCRGLFYEYEFMDGTRKGSLGWTQRIPPQESEDANRS